MRNSTIALKRVYETAGSDDGNRFLVERLWPRGIQKAKLHLDGWLKDIAPSTELRKWFAHDPARWTEFQRRYTAELRENRAACEPVLNAARSGKVTLLYSAHDTEHNNAIVLKDYLDKMLKSA